MESVWRLGTKAPINNVTLLSFASLAYACIFLREPTEEREVVKQEEVCRWLHLQAKDHSDSFHESSLGIHGKDVFEGEIPSAA